jgi:hypothetical protein
MRANISVKVLDVRFHAGTMDGMRYFHDLGQMGLNAALLAMWGARWTAGRTVDASTANLSPNLRLILRQFCFGNHGSASWVIGSREGCRDGHRLASFSRTHVPGFGVHPLVYARPLEGVSEVRTQ